MKNERHKHDLRSNIFLDLKKSSVVKDIFVDSVVDDLMDQVFVKVICSLRKVSKDLVRLSEISLLMIDFKESCIQVLFRL